jgi:2-isopropylmalate synthase
MNMFSQGVDPELDMSDMNSLVRVAEHCNQLPVHPRHPWAGELVFTAFSGSHQDAIKKGMSAIQESNSGIWEVPYLPIDPQDVGSTYEAVIRINSQSGKGGVAYILEQDFGYVLPRRLQIEFSQVIQRITDDTGGEITSEDIWKSFNEEYLDATTPFDFVEHRTVPDTHASERRSMTAVVRVDGAEKVISGKGNGPIDSYVDALKSQCDVDFKVIDYRERAFGAGADARAVAYVEIETPEGALFGVGEHVNIVTASLKAVTSAVNRAIRMGRGVQMEGNNTSAA